MADMADFLITFQGWRPADYWALTPRERGALVAASERAAKQTK